MNDIRDFHFSIVLAIATADVWQFVAVGFAVHWVCEVLAVRGGVHGASASRGYTSLDAVSSLARWVLRWRRMVDSILNVGLVHLVPSSRVRLLDRRGSVHTVHKVAYILLVGLVVLGLHWVLCLLVGRLVVDADVWVQLVWVGRVSWRCDSLVIGTSVVWSLIVVRPWDIVFLSWLWADSSKSTKSWTSLLVVLMMVVGMEMVIVDHWVSILVTVILVVWSVVIVVVIVVVVIVVGLVVSLVELVQIGSRTLCINCWYLSHYLSVVRVRAVVLLLWSCTTCFVRADFWGTRSSVVVVFVLTCSVRRITVIVPYVEYILIVNYSHFFEEIVKELESFSVTLMQSVSSKLFKFSIGDLFCLFNLSRVQLDLCGVDSSSCWWQEIVIWFHIIWVDITVVIRMMNFLGVILWISSSFVLLCNSTLELGDRTFFKFFPHLLLFFKPGVFGLPLFVDIVVAFHPDTWSFDFDMGRLCIWSCHVKHEVIKIIHIVL